MNMKQPVALFGEAEKGSFATLKRIRTLSELRMHFGHPPRESLGLFFAVQFLLFQHDLLYVRVEEEGFSTKDYLKGMDELRKGMRDPVQSICLPGVGDPKIINSTDAIRKKHGCLIVTTERDLYDYLTIIRLQQ